MDVVRHELNHRQAEFGDYGLRGGFGFSGFTTGVPGYTPLQWNNFAGFLLGLPSSFSKDVQTEEMTGREWQSALYVRDRWNVTPKFTVSAGLRAEYYPLMTRADARHRTARLQHLHRAHRRSGRRAGRCRHQPEDLVFRAAPRGDVPPERQVGHARRIRPDDQSAAVVAPDARVVPVRHQLQPHRRSVPRGRHARQRHSRRDRPGRQLRPGEAAARRVHALAESGSTWTAAIIQQWNVAYEHRLPGDISAEVAYVGTRTDGGYADLNINYGVPGGGNASRQYFAVAGTTAINDWAARTKSRYHGLQLSREPAVQEPVWRSRAPTPTASRRTWPMRMAGSD